jgi:hypothetical protein
MLLFTPPAASLIELCAPPPVASFIDLHVASSFSEGLKTRVLICERSSFPYVVCVLVL